MLYDQHPMLDNKMLQYIPHLDGPVFDPPVKFKLLMLEDSYVIAEKFEVDVLTAETQKRGEKTQTSADIR